MKIAIIVGTRPEIIKFSPIIRICERDKIDYFVIHTGQHYSYEMDSIFFKQLKLPQPKYNLGIKSSAPHLQGEHTGKMLIEIEKILMKKITTTKSFTGFDIKLGHIEACIRSHWDEMPEEVNRKIADHLSDFLYAPTAKSVDNAHRENIDMSKIIITGNTIVDAVHQISEIAKDVKILDDMKLDGQKYLVATMHRQENVNSEKRFVGILKGLEKIYKKYRMPIVYPIHPRTRKIIDKMGIVMPEGVIETEPLGVLEFFQLQKHAYWVSRALPSGIIQKDQKRLMLEAIYWQAPTQM